jgi:hypothetical protein
VSTIKPGQHGEPWAIEKQGVYVYPTDAKMPSPLMAQRTIDCVNFCDGHNLEQSLIVPKALRSGATVNRNG